MDSTIPEGLTADYANIAAEEALAAFQETPDWERFTALLNTLREGYLVVDVTGTPKKKATRIRTIRSTTGQLLLPLFTSMEELRRAVQKPRSGETKGAMMPALEALALIRTDRFVACQLNAGSDALVILRKFVALALEDDPVTVEAVEAAR